MAWTYAYPSAGQNGDATANYWTYRNMKGSVQMRLTDVSFLDGAQWYSPCSFTISLINSAGSVLSTATIQKSWGVDPGFATIAFFTTNQSVRMRVKSSVVKVPGLYREWMEFKSEVRWNNV